MSRVPLTELVGRAGNATIRGRWRGLSLSAWLYLLHMALLTCGLAITSLFFNLAILALGYERSFLGLLNMASVAVAAALSLPLWWLAGRVSLRSALLWSGVIQALSALALALWPTAAALLLASAGTGIAAVLFQVTAAPFMMRHSDESSRDTVFSANAAINVGLAGIGSLLGGYLPRLLGGVLNVPSESALAYRATFAVAGLGLLLALLPLLFIRDPQPETQNPRPEIRNPKPARAWRIPEPWCGMLQRPWPLIQLLIPPGLISLGAALLIPYLNLFFKERFGSADTTLGAIFAALGIITGLAALAAPALSARLGTIRMVVLTQLCSIPFLLLLGFAPLLWLSVAAAIVRGALFNMGSPLYDAFAMDRSEAAARPTVIGLINAAYAAGYIVAPPLSVYVQKHYGFAPLFVVTALCYGAAVLATYWFFGRS